MNASDGSRRLVPAWAASFAAAAALVIPAGASAATVTQNFTSDGESDFVVPDGIKLIDVQATGAKGGDSLSATGGFGALVTGSLTVEPAATLYVNVGSNGVASSLGGLGGFNGGGNGSSFANPDTAAGGGGGATDIRTVSRSAPDSLESRLVVAAGGGGAGGRGGSTSQGNETRQGGVGGAGGAAGMGASANGANGSDGAGSGTNGGNVDSNTRGRGGRGATVSAGGLGGSGGVNRNFSGIAGGAGGLGSGGNGSTGIFNSAQGRGGGGGGGLYGGGGGGSSTSNSDASSPSVGGGGGGGAGSSLVPSGGAVNFATSSAASASISYTFAETAIAGPSGRITNASPTYELTSPDITGATFECSVDDAAFTSCPASGYSPGPLPVGDHTIRARALDPVTGNADPEPASVEVTVEATTLSLGRPQLNRKRGTAVVPTAVDRAGVLSVSGKDVKGVTARPDSAGKIRLAIKAKGAAAKRLRKTGKATVRFKVTFNPAEGETVSENYTLNLVKKRR